MWRLSSILEVRLLVPYLEHRLLRLAVAKFASVKDDKSVKIWFHLSVKKSTLCLLLYVFCFGLPGFAKPTYRVQKTDEQWRKTLPPDAYNVLRKAGTEAPFTGEHLKEKRKGTYVCRGCGESLFLSNTKFESGCGWPSFYKPAGQKSVLERKDTSHNMVRTEILCSGCGGHLGHVFEDGPPPTHLRYCINSDALDFRPAPPDKKTK